jgi:excisionase family DNA binding protein
MRRDEGSMSAGNLPEFLTVREAAELLRVNVKTVHLLLADGLPHLRLGQRIIRISRDVLLSWGKVA